ncbi:MAG: FG-GAP-like repeat-containing protein [Phycisphaerales bacterium]|jgi:hypothetical protein|nr:FG-GAP-like repeat-containing protein [Phycisphaerales bacterium]
MPACRSVARPVVVSALLALFAGQAANAQVQFVSSAADAGLVHSYRPGTGYPGMHAEMTGAACVADFNRDGKPDVFLTGGSLEPDGLFINVTPDFGPGSAGPLFEDRAQAAGVARVHRSGGAIAGDVNNDGWPDLFVVSYGDAPGANSINACRLYINQGVGPDGTPVFVDDAIARGVSRVASVVDGMGAAFGDYDLDGDLDLYVASWMDTPGGNRLFANEGSGHFTDVTTSVLPTPSRPLRGFTPRFADLNGDRYPELLLTDDFNTSRVYVNLGPDAQGVVHYADRTAASGVTLDCNGMGSTLGDFDRDGVLDWFMTNIYFPPPADTCGNTLYMCVGESGPAPLTPVFEEDARGRGALDAGWGWGVSAMDVDNDGDEDLAATGGWFDFVNKPARVYLNDGTAHFTEIAQPSGVSFVGLGRALVHLDADGDGDLDFALVPKDEPVRFFRNDTPAQGGYLRITLDTSAHPCLAPDGFGATVVVRGAGPDQLRVHDGKYTYMGHSEHVMHFGLGAAESVDVEVRWNDGSVTTLADVARDHAIVVHAFHPADLNENATIDSADFLVLFDRYVARDPTADVNHDGAVNSSDFLWMLNRLVDPCGH